MQLPIRDCIRIHHQPSNRKYQGNWTEPVGPFCRASLGGNWKGKTEETFWFWIDVKPASALFLFSSLFLLILNTDPSPTMF